MRNFFEDDEISSASDGPFCAGMSWEAFTVVEKVVNVKADVTRLYPT